VRRPPQRSSNNNFDAAGSQYSSQLRQPRGSLFLLPRPRQGGAGELEEDVGDSDDNNDVEGGTLSTSSLGRNHRLSFLGLLAPQSSGAGPAVQHLVRMSSQPPTRYGYGLSSSTSSRGGGTGSGATKPKPFLSMSLLKLNEILPAYCRALVDPAQGPAKACSMLDSSLATATSWSPSSSPSARRSGENETKAMERRREKLLSNGSSPTSGSFLQWLAPPTSTAQTSSSFLSARATSSSPPSSNSAMAMEGEWESYTAPFFLLAAADILYFDMNHCFHRQEEASTPDSPQEAAALSKLYRRIINDILRVKEVLCDPLLSKPTEGEAAEGALRDVKSSDAANLSAAATTASPGLVSSSVQRSTGAARTLSATLERLVAVCRIRSQLVAFQCQLFASAATFVHGAADSESDRDVANAGDGSGHAHPTKAIPSSQVSPSSCLREALQAVVRILQTLPVSPEQSSESKKDEDSSFFGAHILYQSTVRECHKWKYCLEAACGLDRCR
jgi:hypothetical protein